MSDIEKELYVAKGVANETSTINPPTMKHLMAT